MGKTYFTSDLHAGHGNIIKYSQRPFFGAADKAELERIGRWHDGNWKGEGSSDWRMSQEAVKLMDDELFSQINKTVKPEDTLYHLGDFAMPGKQGYHAKCREYRDRINCRDVRQIWGNHDDRKIGLLFTETHDLLHLTLPQIPEGLVLCHYAMAIWDKSHRRAMHLYGHSHAEAEGWLDRMMPGRRSMDVGVDNAARLLGAYRPFSVDDVVRILGPRKGFFFGGDIDTMAKSPPEEKVQEKQ